MTKKNSISSQFSCNLDSKISSLVNLFIQCRCLFLKFGSEQNISRISINSSSFFDKFFILCHGVLFYNIWAYFWINYENPPGDRNNFLLYRACYDPKQIYSSPFYALMPVSTFLLVCFDVVLIGGNFYIFIYLKKFSTKRMEGN